MNTPSLSLNAVSSWLNHHKFLLTITFTSLIAASAYFASAEELRQVHLIALDNQKTDKIQELRYHIDTLSKIKEADRPPEIQRALESYRLQKKALIEAGS